MDEAEIERELDRMERDEREHEALFGRLYDAIGRGEFGDTFAGCWRDEELVFVAVTDMPERAKRVIAEHPAAVTLRQHFAGRPISWSEGTVEPV